MVNDQGGIRNEYHQEGDRKLETQIKQNTCPVSQQPKTYTEEARRMDQANEQFDQKTKQLHNQKEHNEKLAQEKCSKIKELESEARSAAKDFNKEHEKHAKSKCFHCFIYLHIFNCDIKRLFNCRAIQIGS
jgi:CRISPR/Cas system-associated endonuclease Cas1